ncbi:response regulator [Fulvivirga lutea]|uniref:Response regulator n=1 Tax=Fulvivirga lutea TaxID=2810512 RepID=A0A975A118_9BACT|nr:response regulator [Fulvivirga lutea]QSE97406.1 response regulator [Fulvivirga lutea]
MSPPEVLIVDDEEDIGQMVSLMLRPYTDKIKYCTSIGEGAEEIENHQFDLIFLDLNLEDGTGFDLLEKMNQDNYTTNVVVISAYDGKEEEERVKEFKVAGFIKKPFTKNDIIEAFLSNVK